MARPLPTGKQTVNLASGEVRVSKIRRDPPPAEKPKALRHPDEVNRSAVIVGVVAFALAIFVIILAVGSYNGWSPRQYTIDVKL
ncbi:MAG TPA: hypothetical protein VFR60_07625 [Sphingomicrobium sp.]|nr:hypothetical protein [Sphingomicrobium sp.]